MQISRTGKLQSEFLIYRLFLDLCTFAANLSETNNSNNMDNIPTLQNTNLQDSNKAQLKIDSEC